MAFRRTPIATLESCCQQQRFFDERSGAFYSLKWKRSGCKTGTRITRCLTVLTSFRMNQNRLTLLTVVRYDTYRPGWVVLSSCSGMEPMIRDADSINGLVAMTRLVTSSSLLSFRCGQSPLLGLDYGQQAEQCFYSSVLSEMVEIKRRCQSWR